MIPTLGEIHFVFAIDTQGYTIAIVGWFIVFLALVILVMIFTNIPNLIYYKSKKAQRVEKRTALKTEIGSDDYHISNEVSAAIAMSINLFFSEQHDEESNIITIKHVGRRYSPWSSKIYGIGNWPKN